ncbi:hypothetical protein L873DRAFT_1806348 [Choiromyces venosus 120613-1]|uniref:Uncharacterized protein n=1 Tax=Choiromyces venosus 120613-1 TaxID=1336337 RepID=A0A3N4JNQ1_9PEZI|nr:hypothetical protein L873DRAFT_1806348 [Choiromyces venosus 120613-1]
MGESRQELLNWLNGLLQLNITRIEQCGTGYVTDEQHPLLCEKEACSLLRKTVSTDRDNS